ncbi:DUF262 domain-containing protein [Leptospira kmetyi]|uniref:DUF262 domain-containing protein n=1 Tax=Leptospira kmetyi TaxID=408139 RepID=A0AAD0US97_9LEPT|nr:DUF262 domain-containing protein [Leptospira kmetyi]AYV57678.1 DUF262 domain-containing protein [Leptospira kmetyi]
MKQPKPITRKYSELIENVDKGNYQIPKFQRNFVWNIEKVSLLMDSIIKGYPIGTFILWKTKERLKSLKKIGNRELFMQIEGDYVFYVLDGQQRITSLFLCINGVDDFKNIYLDLENIKLLEDGKSKQLKFVDITKSLCSTEPIEGKSILIHDALHKSSVDLLDQFDRDTLAKIEIIKNIFSNYEFSTIEIESLPLNQIVDVFTRINTSGQQLTLFEIMNAKVYDEDSHFDLEEKYLELYEELKNADFETTIDNPVVLLQLVSAIINKDSKRDAILSIKKETFIEIWEDATESLKKAIDKVRQYLFIPVSNLVPFNALIICIAYFYYINDKIDPDHGQLENIKKYFYRSAFSFRYSKSADSTINSDLSLMKKIKENEEIDFDKAIVVEEHFKNEEKLAELLIKTDFSTSNSFCKAILCLYASKSPLNFKDNSRVIIDNSWLSRSNSKNYHHFFPKGFLEKIQNTESLNSIVNIVFIDDNINKNEIRAKSPNDYIRKYERENPQLPNSLKTHYIENLEQSGIFENDYQTFLKKRALSIANEISRLI